MPQIAGNRGCFSKKILGVVPHTPPWEGYPLPHPPRERLCRPHGPYFTYYLQIFQTWAPPLKIPGSAPVSIPSFFYQFLTIRPFTRAPISISATLNQTLPVSVSFFLMSAFWLNFASRISLIRSSPTGESFSPRSLCP